MRRSISLSRALAVSLALLVAGCRDRAATATKPATPREAVERYLTRLEGGDLSGARTLLCTDDHGRIILEDTAPGNPSFVTPERLGKLEGFEFTREGTLAGQPPGARWLRFALRGGPSGLTTLGFAVQPDPTLNFCILSAL